MQQNLFLTLLLLTIITSCTSTRITSSWKASASTPIGYKKVLVMALLQPDNALKQQMEKHLVGDLESHGIQAVSAYEQYRPKAFENMTEQASLEKIQNTGVDAILTIVLLDKSRERYYVPSHITFTPYAVYYSHFWGYYTTLRNRVYMPGYYVNNTQYFWESNLYDAASKQLVYSVKTKSFNPENLQTLAHEYGQLIINNMVQQKIIAQQQ
jgi:hypothetical protein